MTITPFLSGTALIALALTSNAATITFDDGKDGGLKKLDLSAAGLPGAAYSFVDHAGGKAFRIKAPKPPSPDAGPARAFRYGAQSLSRFSISTDIVTWDNSINQAIGLLARAGNIQLGETTGFVMNYNVVDSELQFNRVTGESPTTIAETPVALSPNGGPYRFVWSAYDGHFLGQVFTLSDLANPIASVVADDDQYPTGNAGIFVFDRNNAPTFTFTDATFDNFQTGVPAAGSLGAIAVTLLPTPGTRSTALRPAVSASILNRETDVVESSVELWMDSQKISSADLEITSGVVMPNSAESFAGLTVKYLVPSLLPTESAHTNRLVFSDSSGVRHTNEWIWISAFPNLAQPVSPASNGAKPGWDVHVVQAPASPLLENSLVRAEAQLSRTSTIPRSVDTNVTTAIINFSQSGPGSADGGIGEDLLIPGIDGTDVVDRNTENIAMEAFGYIELPKGESRLGAQGDDGFRLQVQVNGVWKTLFEHDRGPGTETADLISEAGLYHFRLIWYERSGGAHIELFASAPDGSRTLVGAPGGPKVFSLVVISEPALRIANNVTGPFLQLVDGVVITGTGATRTVSVPLPSGTRFYQGAFGIGFLRSPRIEGQRLVFSAPESP